MHETVLAGNDFGETPSLLRVVGNASRIEKLVLEYFQSPAIEKERIKNLTEWLAALARNALDEEILVATSEIRESIRQRRSLDSSRVAVFLGLLRDLVRQFQKVEFPVDVETLLPPSGTHKGSWVSRIDELFEKDVSPTLDKAQLVENIRRTVNKSPGLYLMQLRNRLVRETGRDIHYQTVRGYVESLARQKKLLTIGGPQGRLRFCFPHPSTVLDRATFLGKQFGVDARVQRDLTDEFVDLSADHFRSVYLVNSTMRPVLLAVPRSVPLEPATAVRAFGLLVKLAQAKKAGVKPTGSAVNLPREIVKVVKVAKVLTGGKEEELWFDPRWASQLPLELSET